MPTPFPTDVLPEVLREFVCETAESIGCDRSFVALPVLSTVAAAVGNARQVQIRSGWTEASIVWTALIADPGFSKSPALKSAINPLIELQEFAEPSRRHRSPPMIVPSASQKSQVKVTAAETESQRAETGRIVTSDTSVPKLVQLLQNNPRGLLLIRDELAGWVEGVEKRFGGDHWLSIHSGCPITVDRANRGSVFVRRAAVSITGGFQPAVLRRCLLASRHRENGMAARFLFSWPEKRIPIWSDSPVRPEMVAKYSRVLLKLLDLAPITTRSDPFEPVTLRLTPEARAHFKSFFEKSAQEQLHLNNDLAATWPKLRAYAARLALIIALADWAESDDAAPLEFIDVKAMESGIHLAQWFGEQARIVYASNDDCGEDFHRVLGIIQSRGGALTANELCRYDRAIRSSEDAERVLNNLARGGHGCWENVRPGELGGRPTRRFVLLVGETI